MSSNPIAVQMSKVLDEFDDKVQRVTNEAITRTARESVSKLKNESPRKTGEYASGWSSKNGDKNGRIVSKVVYNRKAPGLTHLLENGHVIRNAKGTYGRTRAIKHIEPVEEWANEELVNEIERELQ